MTTKAKPHEDRHFTSNQLKPFVTRSPAPTISQRPISSNRPIYPAFACEDIHLDRILYQKHPVFLRRSCCQPRKKWGRRTRILATFAWPTYLFFPSSARLHFGWHALWPEGGSEFGLKPQLCFLFENKGSRLHIIQPKNNGVAGSGLLCY